MKLNIGGQIIDVAEDILSKAIEDKTESIEIKADGLVIRSIEDEETFITNARQLGFVDGTEVGRKNVFTQLEIEPNGAHKDDARTKDALMAWKDGFVLTALTDAKIDPDKKLESAQKDMELLRANLLQKDDAIAGIQGQFDRYKKTQTITSTLSGLIPDNTIIPKDDMLTLMGTRLKADVNENGVVFAVGVDGQPIKNPITLEVLPIKDAVTQYFNDNPQYLKTVDGGAGGGDSGAGGAGKKQTQAHFISEMEAKGFGAFSAELRDEMMKRITAGTLES